MLHIHCGDTSADALRRAKVHGDVIVWTDNLIEGPVPADRSPEEWRRVRATHLSDATRGLLSAEQVFQSLEKQDLEISNHWKNDEVVLWFDSCLFDHLILIRQLDWLARQDRRSPKTSLIYVSHCGLGELAPHQLAALLEQKKEITAEQYELAKKAWTAFCSDDPTGIERILQDDCSALPQLKAALTRHLEQFPSTRNGLNRMENEALNALGQGHSKLVNIFVEVDRLEECPFFGDTTLWACLDHLSRGSHPLLSVDGPGPLPLWNPPKKLVPWTLYITDAGLDVLAGKQDAIRLNGIDRWLGGVHLKGNEPAWRWDARTLKMVVRS